MNARALVQILIEGDPDSVNPEAYLRALPTRYSVPDTAQLYAPNMNIFWALVKKLGATDWAISEKKCRRIWNLQSIRSGVVIYTMPGLYGNSRRAGGTIAAAWVPDEHVNYDPELKDETAFLRILGIKIIQK